MTTPTKAWPPANAGYRGSRPPQPRDQSPHSPNKRRYLQCAVNAVAVNIAVSVVLSEAGAVSHDTLSSTRVLYTTITAPSHPPIRLWLLLYFHDEEILTNGEIIYSPLLINSVIMQ